MSNPLYKEMMGMSAGGNIMQMLSQLKNNPLQFLASRGFNIPPDVGNDPNSIIRYLMNSEQISQWQYNKVVQAVNSLRMFNN